MQLGTKAEFALQTATLTVVQVLAVKEARADETTPIASPASPPCPLSVMAQAKKDLGSTMSRSQVMCTGLAFPLLLGSWVCTEPTSAPKVCAKLWSRPAHTPLEAYP